MRARRRCRVSDDDVTIRDGNALTDSDRFRRLANSTLVLSLRLALGNCDRTQDGQNN